MQEIRIQKLDSGYLVIDGDKHYGCSDIDSIAGKLQDICNLEAYSATLKPAKCPHNRQITINKEALCLDCDELLYTHDTHDFDNITTT